MLASMSRLKSIYVLVVLVVALWSIVVIGVSLFSDEALLFIPTQQLLSQLEIANRLEVLRLTLFGVFAYFALFHVFAGKKRFSSGHVLASILTILTLVSSLKIFMLDNFYREAGYIVIFGLSAIFIILGSRPSVRRYFKRRR